MVQLTISSQSGRTQEAASSSTRVGLLNVHLWVPNGHKTPSSEKTLNGVFLLHRSRQMFPTDLLHLAAAGTCNCGGGDWGPGCWHLPAWPSCSVLPATPSSLVSRAGGSRCMVPREGGVVRKRHASCCLEKAIEGGKNKSS